MIDLDNRTDASVNIELLQRIADSLTDKEIELILINDEEMAKINEETRDIAKSTDVLSFPFFEMPGAPLGSIVISEDYVTAGAEKFGHTKDDERALLFIHGMLHILGYDHEVDEGEMRVKEAEIIVSFDLPSSLIVRTEDM
ncbi:MAG: rRNA maturation RNase YbeY [Helicobacteraceae bacterium]|jgi:probable rRNA maturation factor|nr:rRNA maturation RNase YbeY [Helicobacteraceae bacterium]